MIVSPPLASWRATAVTTSAQATVTLTAATGGNVPTSSPSKQIVVDNISVGLSCGTAALQGAVINLIDGTSGGTNVMWRGVLGAAANTTAPPINVSDLRLPCLTNLATLEFAVAGTGAVVQSVAMSGRYIDYGGS